MGNSSGSDALYVEDDSISKIEHEKLRHLFDATNSKADYNISMESFCQLFQSSVYPSFGHNLFNSINPTNAKALKFSEFYKFALLACKTSVSSCMKCLLVVFKVEQIQDSGIHLYDVHSFLKFCCEIGNKNSNPDSIEIVGSKLFQHFVRKVSKSNMNISDDVTTVKGYDFDTVNSWMHEFFPCISQLLFTWINLICFHDTVVSPSSSFNLFKSPNLISDSETYIDNRILKYGEEFLLSLQSDKLQGSWKLLYNSNVHGRSFNRIAHHLLGYEVSCDIIIDFVSLITCLFFLNRAQRVLLFVAIVNLLKLLLECLVSQDGKILIGSMDLLPIFYLLYLQN